MGGDVGGNVSPFVSALIGGVTGAIEISITYPTEYTKTVMQLYPEMNKKGAITVVKETMATGGYLKLYKGYSALLMFSVPKNYVRFGAFTYARNHLFTDTKNKAHTFACGLMAGACEAAFVVTPQETLKTKLIHDMLSEKPKYRNIFHGIYTIARSQGFWGIYAGPIPTILKQSSNQGVRFVVFEDAQKVMNKIIPIKVAADLCAGAIAGSASVLLNNPVDVIKTNIQGLESHKYKGFVDCFNQILKNEGPMGFYKGVGPRLARVTLDVGLTFAIFNSLKRWIVTLVSKGE
jgi:solute carrier family 25 (mitochondrial citrate transporter), member 1